MGVQQIRNFIVFGTFFLTVNIICHKFLYGSFIFKDMFNYYRITSTIEDIQVFRNEQAKEYYTPGFSQPSPQICNDFGLKLKLLVIVTSPPNHLKERTRVRKTWGRKKDVLAIGYLMGQTDSMSLKQSLVAESNSFSDIIITNFKDDFKNLTLLSMAMMQWVTEYCPNVTFLLKVDDQMYINMPRLFHFLDEQDQQENAIYGELVQLAEPDRYKWSKYFVSKEQYSPGIYPNYIVGQAYVLPAYLAPIFYGASLNQKFLGIDDIFMTGLVAQSLRTRRVRVGAFSNDQPFRDGGPCSVYWIISTSMDKFMKQLEICDKSWNF